MELLPKELCDMNLRARRLSSTASSNWFGVRPVSLNRRLSTQLGSYEAIKLSTVSPPAGRIPVLSNGVTKRIVFLFAGLVPLLTTGGHIYTS